MAKLIKGMVYVAGAMLSFIEGIRHNSAWHDITYAALVLFALVCVATDYFKLLLNPSQFWFFFWFPVAIVTALSMGSGLASKTSFSTIDSGNHRHPESETRNRLHNS